MITQRNPATRYTHLLDAAGIPGQQQIYLDALKTRITTLTVQAAQDYGKGRALDIGAGPLYLADELRRFFEPYITLDIEIRSPRVNLLGDAQSLPFSDKTFDTVISTDVLEHVQRPGQMFREIARVLAPSGVLILVTPFYFWAHEEPHDFFRVSKYGLLHLCRENSLDVLRIEPTCGIIASMGSLGTVALARLLHRFPPLLMLMLGLNCALQRSVLLWLDDRVDRSKRLAQGHLVVATKN
jgi:SAM-dependent methyltransferase